ncbi:MAG: radical SAM protein [Planctomycetota bacterium]
MSDERDIDYAALTRENERAVLASEEAARARVDALPMKITFEFTGDCNLHCFFCDCEFGRNVMRREGVHRFAMDEEKFRWMAENAFPRATIVNPTVVGEPFTFPFFDVMLEYAERYDVKLEIVTNGMLLKGPRMERLLPLLDRLIMSFDGGTKEVFEHCRTGSKFEVGSENLRAFRDPRRKLGLERQAKFSFGVTLMRENIEDLVKIVEWGHELGADEVNAGHLLVFTKELRGSSLFGHKALSNRMIAAAQARARELGVRMTAPAPFDLDGEDEVGEAPETPAEITGLVPSAAHLGGDQHPRPSDSTYLAAEAPAPSWAEGRFWCKFAWREVFINYFGDVAPCCHQGRPVVGNVFTDPWDEIWNGVEYQLLRSSLYERKPRPYCASCSLLAEQGLVDYDEKGYIFEDRYPDQDRADTSRPGRRARD